MVRDPGLAEDVTQAVFIVLARKAPRLARKPSGAEGSEPALSAWLFGVTRHAARVAVRSRARRERHEARAGAMTYANSNSRPANSDGVPTDGPDAATVSALDDMVARLGRRDREAVLLRFYERKSFVQIGAATGVSEEAARKRVNRAVERLRASFARKGVTLPAAAVLVLLAGAVDAAPATLAARAYETALAGGAAGAAATTLAKGALTMMAMSKLKMAAAVFAVVCLTGGAGAWISAGVIRGGHDGAGDGRGSIVTAGASTAAPPSASAAGAPADPPLPQQPPSDIAAPQSIAVAVAPQDDSPAPRPDGTGGTGAQPAAAEGNKGDVPLVQQLDRKLPEVNFDGVGLSDAIDFLRDVSGANIAVNWKALEAAGINRNAPVTVRLKDVKFDQALKSLLASAGGNTRLVYTVEGNVINITTADDGAAAGDGAAPPDKAKAGGGADGAAPAVEKIDPRLKAQLDRPLPELNFGENGLSDVIDFFRDVSGANIAVNWKALEEVGIERTTPVTLRLKNVKLSQALDSVLTSAGGNTKLRFTIEDNVITITSADAGAAPAKAGARAGAAAPAGAPGKGVIRTVYNVRKLTGRLIPPRADAAGVDAAAESVAARRNAIVHMITGSVAPASWKANGGSGTGEIAQSGNELVIDTSAENHKAIANLLQQLEKLLAPPGAAASPGAAD
jgi:RNA polymerase sigma factor (sigma-70 family)